MFKLFQFLLTLLLPMLLNGQVKVYKTFEDYNSGVNFTVYKKIKYREYKNMLVLVDSVGGKTTLSYDSVWGFTYMDGQQEKLNRIDSGKIYLTEVLHKQIILYQCLEKSTMVAGNIVMSEYIATHYFSKKFDEKPLLLTEENLLSAFQFSDSQIGIIKELVKQKRLSKKNKKSKQYYLIEMVFEN